MNLIYWVKLKLFKMMKNSKLKTLEFLKFT